MPKNRCKSGEEWLRGRVRELEKQNRQLQKRVRQLEKTEHMFEESLLEEEPILVEEELKQAPCLECGKGKIKVINILDRIFEECTVCDYRRKVSSPV